MIKRQVYPELDLVLHTVTGKLDENEFLDAAAALYDLDPVPLKSLWDLSGASLSQYNLDRLRDLQARTVGLVHGREGGRTAVVAPKDVDFGVSRQYVALIECAQLPFEHEAFRTVGEALGWLGLDAGCLDASAPSKERF